MKKYNLKFKNGKVYSFEADYIEDDGKKLKLMLNDGTLVAGYQDSDIAACEVAEKTSIVAGEPHMKDGAILYNKKGEVVSIYRTQEAAME